MKIIIKITKVFEEQQLEREYHRVADSGNVQDGGPVYEYVDKGVKTVKRETDIFKQELECDSIKHIVAAVNGLEIKGG